MDFNDRRQAKKAHSAHVKDQSGTPKKVGRKGHVPQVSDTPKAITRKRPKKVHQ